MECYKDRCFCPFYLDCEDGEDCARALTDEIYEGYEKFIEANNIDPNTFGIDTFIIKPYCFKEKE